MGINVKESVTMNQNEKTRRVSDTNGFTFIEVLIVLAIFSIGILGAMSMQTSAVSLNTKSQKSGLANAYATDTMERLMSVPAFNGRDDDGDGTADNTGEAGFDDLDAAKNPHMRADTYDSDADSADDLPADAYYAGIFNLNWNVTDVDVRTKRIAITVTWNSGKKQEMLTAYRINQ